MDFGPEQEGGLPQTLPQGGDSGGCVRADSSRASEGKPVLVLEKLTGKRRPDTKDLDTSLSFGCVGSQVLGGRGNEQGFKVAFGQRWTGACWSVRPGFGPITTSDLNAQY